MVAADSLNILMLLSGGWISVVVLMVTGLVSMQVGFTWESILDPTIEQFMVGLGETTL